MVVVVVALLVWVVVGGWSIEDVLILSMTIGLKKS